MYSFISGPEGLRPESGKIMKNANIKRLSRAKENRSIVSGVCLYWK